MSSFLSGNSVLVAAKHQVSCDLAGAAAVLNTQSGVYYGLDVVGAHVWRLLQEPRSVDEIREVLAGEYDVEPERCQQDLLALLERLLAEGLIEVKGG